MTVSPSEAEEALAAIQSMARKARRSIAGGGTYVTLIITGIVWLTGFTCTQFLPADLVGYAWATLSLLGTVSGLSLGFKMGARVRSPLTIPVSKRVSLFWGLLVLYGVARPTDGKQATMLVVLFIMLGQLSMGLLFSFADVLWALPVAALGLIGFFLLPGVSYLWMAILGGGGMIALGLCIRYRW